MYARMLQKAQRRGTGSANARVHTLPAPVGGWNARDAFPAMKPEDAIILDNIIPDHGRVRLRNGYIFHAPVGGGACYTLMEYAPPSGVNQLFGAGPTGVYNVTSPASTPSAEFTGMSNGKWQHTMMATIGGNFLCIVNGANNYRTYNGSAWTDQNAAVTGITGGAANTTEFSNIAIHANRLWFVQKDTLDAWYLPTASITGAATKFPLGPLCKEGGSLLAIGRWTKDAGDGMDDLIVFITTKGEVIVYQGTNPSDALYWQLVGVFRISEPAGKRCLIKVGGDLGIITSTGVALLSTLMGANRSGQRKVSITNKISRAFVDAYAVAGSEFGWQIQEFPSQGLVIVNVPAAGETLSGETTAYQYVINIETGGWCRFTGINALCWSLKGEDLFFGGVDGSVYQFGTELDDDGEAITWKVQMAYNRLQGNNNKVFRMVRALLTTVAGYVPGVLLMFNYDTEAPSPETPLAEATGSPWDTSPWDTSAWGTPTEETAQWQSIDGEGRSVSVVLAGSSIGAPLEFNEIDLMVEDASWI